MSGKVRRKRKNKRTTVENRNTLTAIVTNPMVLVLVITAGAVLLAAKFWSDQRDRLRGEPEFAVGPDKIQLTAQPEWIRSDFREAALQDFDWQNRSLLDSNLVADLGQHLQQQLWIRQVTRVQKQPQVVTVDVQFRRPVAMVELRGKELYPVDTEGVVLDSDEFSPSQLGQYLRIAIAGLPTNRPFQGKTWPDARVVEASQIADLLTQAGIDLGVVGIYGISRQSVTGSPAPSERKLETEYRLWTANNNEIIWGHAVGAETAGEASALQKMSALTEVTQRHGPIDQLQELLLPKGNVLDLRGGKLELRSKAARIMNHLPR